MHADGCSFYTAIEQKGEGEDAYISFNLCPPFFFVVQLERQSVEEYSNDSDSSNTASSKSPPNHFPSYAALPHGPAKHRPVQVAALSKGGHFSGHLLNCRRGSKLRALNS